MNNKNLNFVFFGTPEIASRTLEILKENGYLPSLIVTSPDKPQGRKMIITPPPVKNWSIQNNIPYFQPEKITPEFIASLPRGSAASDSLRGLPRGSASGDSLCGLPRGSASGDSLCGLPRGSAVADLYVVVAYGKILPEELINQSKLGTVNIHYSLLPKYRGASPLEQALLNGDEKTGVCLQQMVYKLDSGPIIAEKEIEININETKDELRDKLIKMGAEMLIEYLPKISAGNLELKYQNEAEATFCKKIKKEDGLIDLNEDSKTLYNKYRAYAGWPGIFYFDKNGKRVKITKARYENKQFIIEKIIKEGEKETDYKNFLKN